MTHPQPSTSGPAPRAAISPGSASQADPACCHGPAAPPGLPDVAACRDLTCGCADASAGPTASPASPVIALGIRGSGAGAGVGAGPEQAEGVPLTQLRTGEVGVIVDKRLDEHDRATLRAMGLSTSASIKLCRAGQPCIVTVLAGVSESVVTAGAGAAGPVAAAAGPRSEACRIGLARALAERIYVRPRR